MKIVMADVYGFCFGVKRALDKIDELVAAGKHVATLGPVTHNKIVMGELASKGVNYINCVSEFDKSKSDILVVRAHGVAPSIYDKINETSIDFVDLTCPSVTKNQQLAKKKQENGFVVIITGDANHPEVEGLCGWTNNQAVVIANNDAILSYKFSDDKKYFLMSQTTFCTLEFEKIEQSFIKLAKNFEVKNTICQATDDRQQAAKKLAHTVDVMLILGDKSSSNSVKLYEICKGILPNSELIENIFDLDLKNFSSYDIIGITAGASTPPTAIEEVIKKMNELEKNLDVSEAEGMAQSPVQNNSTTENEENFEQMLNESVKTLRTGQVVTGKVISIVNGEVMVDLQYKSDGIIQRGQFSEENVDPSTVVSPGDDITVHVLRVNDTDGNVLLSKKKVDAQKGYRDLEAAFESKEPVLGKVTELIKGGLIVMVGGVRVFVPSSQATARFTKDLSPLVGQEFKFNITELEKGRSGRQWRIIGSRKDLAIKEENELREKAFAGLEEGVLVKGPVTSIANFGAFIDIGGVDGLIHVSELGWKHVRNVSDVLKVGDIVEAYVLKADKVSGKISLTMKSAQNDPWADIETRFPIDGVVVGKVVRLVPFGAFIELADGVDGLTHISQIANRHIKKPEEALEIGQEVEVKILEVDTQKRKISLSIRQALDIEYDDDYDDYDDYDDDDYDDDDYTEETTTETTEE